MSYLCRIPRSTVPVLSAFIFLAAFVLSSCTHPYRSDPSVVEVPAFIAPASQPPSSSINLDQTEAIADSANSPDCVNNLKYIDDLTIPDGTFVEQDAIIEKQWEVENSGTCNWSSSYTLQHIGGQPLGAKTQQALFPAKKGARAVITVTFFAPAEIGTYHTAWQAFDPEGTAFGDPIYMDIVVTSTNP